MLVYNIFIVLALLVANLAAATSNSKSKWESKSDGKFQYTQPFTHEVPRQVVQLDFKQLHKQRRELSNQESGGLNFSHGKELLASLLAKKRHFVVEDTRTPDIKDGRRLSFEEIAALEEYKLKGEYTLLEDATYHVLDDVDELSLVRDIGPTSVDYCGDVKVGDFFLGGAISSGEHANEWMKNTDLNDGDLLFSRQVTDVKVLSEDAKTCYHLSTEVVFPQELFSHFRLSSHSELPIAHHYHPESVNTEAFPGGGPSSPGYSCTDKDIFPKHVVQSEKHGASGDDFVISAYSSFGTWWGACLSVTKNLGNTIGTNFNYNYCPTGGTAAACESITIINGVTCSNCYAYLGVYAFVVLEYWKATSSGTVNMAFEAKLYGGMGYNVDLSIQNPSVSGSKRITLLPAASPSSKITIPVGGGITLSTYSGGLDVVLSGSGSATATAKFGTGASATGYAGVAYESSTTRNAWSYPKSAAFSSVTPILQGQISAATVNINAELIATQNFNLGYYDSYLGYQWLGVDFTLSLSGNVDFKGSSTSSASLSVAISSSSSPSVPATGALRGAKKDKAQVKKAFYHGQAHVKNTVKPLSVSSLSEKIEPASSEPDLLVVHVGEVVNFDVTIQGYRPNENTVLFFSLHRDQQEYQPADVRVEEQVPLFTTKFKVPSSGAAVVSVACPIPWDSRVANILDGDGNRTAILSVRSSDDVMKNHFSHTRLLIVADTEADSILTLNDMQQLPSTELPVNSVNLSFSWDATNLHYFQPGSGTIGLGKMVQPLDVQIVAVVEERDAEDGRLLLRRVASLQNAGNPHYQDGPDAVYPSLEGQTFENTGNALASWPPATFVTQYKSSDYDTVPASTNIARTGYVALEVVSLLDLWGWSPTYDVGSSTSSLVSKAKKLSSAKAAMSESKRVFVPPIHILKDSTSIATNPTTDSADIVNPVSRSLAAGDCSSSCLVTLSPAVYFSGAMTNVIVVKVAFPITLATSKITLLTPKCSCLYDPAKNPTATPTRAPSAAPVVIVPPSKSPTKAPSAAPTGTASPTSTASPSTTPTFVPSRNPTASPSFVPTREPTLAPSVQTLPVIEVKADLTMSGFTSVNLSSQEQESVKEGTAKSLGVDKDSVTIDSVTEAPANRRKLGVVPHKISKHLASLTLIIGTTISVPVVNLVQSGSTTFNITAMTTMLKTQIQTAASSGTLATYIQDAATKNNVTVTIDVRGASVTVVVVDAPPIEKEEKSSSSSVNVGLIAGVIGGLGAVVFLVLVVVMYVRRGSGVESKVVPTAGY